MRTTEPMKIKEMLLELITILTHLFTKVKSRKKTASKSINVLVRGLIL